jgi:hypothetical protein
MAALDPTLPDDYEERSPVPSALLALYGSGAEPSAETRELGTFTALTRFRGYLAPPTLERKTRSPTSLMSAIRQSGGTGHVGNRSLSRRQSTQSGGGQQFSEFWLPRWAMPLANASRLRAFRCISHQRPNGNLGKRPSSSSRIPIPAGEQNRSSVLGGGGRLDAESPARRGGVETPRDCSH